MSESKTPMTPEDASRILINADKTGRNEGFKERAQSAATKNDEAAKKSDGGGARSLAP